MFYPFFCAFYLLGISVFWSVGCTSPRVLYRQSCLAVCPNSDGLIQATPTGVDKILAIIVQGVSDFFHVLAGFVTFSRSHGVRVGDDVGQYGIQFLIWQRDADVAHALVKIVDGGPFLVIVESELHRSFRLIGMERDLGSGLAVRLHIAVR